MTINVYVCSEKEPPVDKKEILRYAGVRGSVSEYLPPLEECLALALPSLSYRACYAYLSLSVDGDTVRIADRTVTSSSLAEHLSGCNEAVVFAATVGVELDRLIARYSSVSVTKALILEAIGNERIEALCDSLCVRLKEEAALRGLSTTPRFSQGYGDLPIEFGRDILALLDCPRKIGLYLNESLVMSPSKSVSAIVGLKGKER